MHRNVIPQWGEDKVIFLDLPNRELSVQIIRYNIPISYRLLALEAGWRLNSRAEEIKPRIDICAGKNGMQRTKAIADNSTSKVIFSKGIKLTEEQINELLPYCNALDFEPFRNRTMSMADPGYRGYRDEYTMWFQGITDSYMPIIELPMEYLYDEKHTWPSERLYQFLREKYIKNNKKLSGAL